MFSKQNHSMLHNTLVLFWRYHCMARKPKCIECKFQEICKYAPKEVLFRYKKEFKK
jgi:endonuclease III